MNLLTRLIIENYKKKYKSDSKIVVSNVEELCGIFQKRCASAQRLLQQIIFISKMLCVSTTLTATNNTLLKNVVRQHNVLISPCGD